MKYPIQEYSPKQKVELFEKWFNGMNQSELLQVKEYLDKRLNVTGPVIKRVSPFKCFNGNKLYEGDTIYHMSGETGIIKYVPNFGDQWLVDYGGGVQSRLSLQVGEKGQAIKKQ